MFCAMLTDQQTCAVEYSLSSRVGSIQDGAQTGKTLRAIHQALSLAPSGEKVLLISLANDSVDNLIRKIRENGSNEVRKFCGQSARDMLPNDPIELTLPDRSLNEDEQKTCN
jgi:hypothetical protein